MYAGITKIFILFLAKQVQHKPVSTAKFYGQNAHNNTPTNTTKIEEGEDLLYVFTKLIFIPGLLFLPQINYSFPQSKGWKKNIQDY